MARVDASDIDAWCHSQHFWKACRPGTTDIVLRNHVDGSRAPEQCLRLLGDCGDFDVAEFFKTQMRERRHGLLKPCHLPRRRDQQKTGDRDHSAGMTCAMDR